MPIGLLLTGVAYIRAAATKGLLIGSQADPRTVRALHAAPAERPEVTGVVDLLTMTLGTDRLLLRACLDFADRLSSSDVEQSCVAIDLDLRSRFSDLQEIFLEPVPRSDPVMRERVLHRCGPKKDWLQNLEDGQE